LKCSCGAEYDAPKYNQGRVFSQTLQREISWDVCRDCSDRLEAEINAVKMAKAIEWIPEHLATYGVPLKFRQTAFDLPPSLEKYTPPLNEYFTFRGLCLNGSVGVGKTTAFVSIMREWVKNYVMAHRHLPDGLWQFVSYPRFIMRVQDAYKRDGEKSALELLEDLAKVRYLVIDDLGVEKPTDFVKQATYFVVNEREMNCLPTFISTNFSMEQLDAHLDSRISSRIAGMCDVKELKGADRRLKR
jgi:DNA replication protein DnaC